MTATVYDFSATGIDGDAVPLRTFEGQVLLIVNTASACGFTPQYDGLEKLYRTYKDKGFAVLGFPCNQFGAQEPGDEAEIKEFCHTAFDVTFPLFAKIDVNGANAHPLYKYLKSTAKGLIGTEAVKWNFTKFLVGRDGRAVSRHGPGDAPASLSRAIEKRL